MNGQLNENPLVELIREIAAKSISGRLQLELEKVKVAVYFRSGLLTFAACNVKSFRLGNYLIQSNVISEEDLRYLGTVTKDFDLRRTLLSEERITEAQAQQLQARQVSDVLRLALQWTDGSWTFDPRSNLNEEINFGLDVQTLMIEAARRLPAKFVISRFRNSGEIISPVADPPVWNGWLPPEVFLLSRLQAPTPLSELVSISGLNEQEAHQAIYALALGGFMKRGYWKSTFRDTSPQPAVEVPAPVVEPVKPEKPTLDPDSIEAFLNRLSLNTNYYEVLAVGPTASTAELKHAYYNLARKYHPDRFRSSPGELLGRVESAFARITQAYDTLTDANLRTAYDSKLDAKARTAKLADSAPKATMSEQATATPGDVGAESSTLTLEEQAEIQFKEGYAALELGQRPVAIGLLGSAARAVPNEPRYRAYYGRALALDAGTRRIAEVELQAAIKLEPNNSEYRVMLAELYRDLGFLVRAKSEAERAVAADHNNRRARDLLKSLG
jgi:curved DNA-binding protein CbpA